MAATEAARRNRTTADHDRLPLTPKVTGVRRGSHQTAGRAQYAETPAAPAATPAMHVTPNVVIAARGGVRGAKRGRRSILRVDASELRRFRA